jgi:hypothetical protein
MRTVLILSLLCLSAPAIASERWNPAWSADTVCVEASGEALKAETPSKVRNAVVGACLAALKVPTTRKAMDSACDQEVAKLSVDDRLAGEYLCKSAVDIGFQ